MSVHNVRLFRQDSSYSWGFRLQGGSDYPIPLCIENVGQGSIAERNGLNSGDMVLAINNRPVDHLRHEEAKMEIIRSGNDIEFTIQKGGGPVVWRPHVQASEPQTHKNANHFADHPSSPTYKQAPQASRSLYADLPQITKTSLAANKPNSSQIGNNYNNSPKPFNVGDKVITTTQTGRTKQVFHNTYNSPAGLYANNYVQQTYENTLAAAQAPDESTSFRSVKPPEPGTPRPNLAGASMYCGSCGDMIKGVFVKVQGRVPMHPECLRCTKCGVGLRHTGYFFINESLYCETHARQVAAPPEPGMMPVPVYK